MSGALQMRKSVQEVFQADVRPRPPEERLRLAALILDEFTQSVPLAEVEHTWSKRDQEELTALTLQYAGPIYPDDEEPAQHRRRRGGRLPQRVRNQA